MSGVGEGEVSLYFEDVLLSLGALGGAPDAWGGSEAQDLGHGLRLLALLAELQVAVLLLQVAHHDVVVDPALLGVVTLVYHDQRQV